MALSRPLTKLWFSSVSFACGLIPFSSSSGSLTPGDTVVDAAVLILKNHRLKRTRRSYLRSLIAPLPDGRLTPSQFSQIAVQIRNNPRRALEFFDFTLRHSLSTLSLSSYSTMIHILCRSRMTTLALSMIKSAMCSSSESSTPTPLALLQSMIKSYRVCDSAPFVFDLLVKACIETKKLDVAIEIYSLLKSKHVFLRTSTCNALIELVSESRGASAGYRLCGDIFFSNDHTPSRARPNSNTLNTVMAGFYREGLVGKVEEVWEEFRTKGCEPNLYSFSILMSAYCDEERMEESIRIWEEMTSKDFTPDAISYNTIIGGFCRVGDTEKAEEMYREMAMNGVNATSATFDHLISGHCRNGDCHSAMALYTDMARRRFSPDIPTVNRIVLALCSKNEACEALRIWRAAKKTGNSYLDVESYKVLIRSLCDKGAMEECLQLQAEMALKGYEPCADIYQAFIDGYSKAGNEEMATKLREEVNAL